MLAGTALSGRAVKAGGIGSAKAGAAQAASIAQQTFPIHITAPLIFLVLLLILFFLCMKKSLRINPNLFDRLKTLFLSLPNVLVARHVG
jgi:hypothetical protein